MILTQIVVTVWVNFKETNRNTAVCKFLRFKDKYEVLQNIKKKLKNTGIFIYENFSKATMELRKSLGRSFTVLTAKQNSIYKL